MERKSKKILSLSILCLVAVMCGSVGILSACNEHVHHYEWKYEEGGTEHWKECPDDGVEEEGSRGEHIFIAGECECGATETVAEKKYGKAHGQVKLRGIGGKYEYDFSDVTVDMGDEVDPDFDTETGELNIENIEAGKIHTLTISKPDYQPYVVSVLVEEDDDVEIGGSRGMVLQRDSFDTTVNWGNYNLSKANDETGEISVTNRHFMVLTKDNYDEVAFTLNLNGFKRPGGGIKQGLPLVGDDGNTIEQGIAIAFGKDVLSVRMVGKNKVALWNTWLAGEWKGGNALSGSQEKELYVFKNGEQYLKDFEANNLALTVYRKENRISVFLNGTFIGDGTVDDKYKDVPCSVGIIAHNAVDDISWKHWNFTVDSGNKAVTLTNNTATDAHGTITGIPERVNFGDRVTLTVTPETDYKLSALLINGVNVIKDLHGNSYSFVITKDTTVEAQFAKIVYSSVNATVSGKSFGKITALPQGTDVTLTSNGFDDITTQLAADGLKIDRISAGVWTVNIEGYLPVEITVDDGAEYNAAITLERDPFDTTVNWGEFEFEKANEAKGKFGISNDCFLILSNERYNDVAVTMYLNGTQPWNGNLEQGIAIAFGGTDVLTVRMVGKNKLALWNTWLATSNDWGKGNNALTGSQENGEMYIFDVDGQYLEDFDKGELRLTVYRTGNEIIVYLNGTMVGRGTVDEKYSDAECSVGFVGLNMSKTMKYWDFTVETDNLPEVQKFTVTDNTADDAHGTLAGVPEGKQDFGTSVTITVTPDTDYKLSALLINGVDVLKDIENNQYTFTVKGNTTVEARFEEIVYSSVKSIVNGKSFGKTAALTVGTQVTLSQNGLEDIVKAITANGLEIDKLSAGVWTVKVEGYLNTEITVIDGAEYSDTIVLERDAFNTTVNWNDYNFEKANEALGEFGTNSDNFLVLSNETFDKVAFTIYLNGKPTDNVKGQQGIALAFGKQIITVRMVGKEKLAIWNTWIATDHWGGSAIDGSTENANLYNFGGEGGAAYLTAFDKGELRLTVLRKGHQIFIYLNDNFIGSSSFAEKYDTEKCSVGFVGHSMESSWKYWKFKVEDEIPEFTVTNNTASDANGSLTITGVTGGKAEFGETVTLTLSPSDGYKISKLIVGGEDVTDRLNGSAYSFVIGKDTEVKAEFAQIIPGSVNAAIKGLSFGKTTNLVGKQVTLSSNGLENVTTTVTEDGIISIDSIPAGVWTISVEGYLPKNITVLENTAYNTELVFERDAFNTTVNWGKFNFDKANAETGEFSVANECFLILSNETYDDVGVTMYLNGNQTWKDDIEQGIAIAFGGTDVLTVRMVGKNRLALGNTWIATQNDWGKGSNALTGAQERDLHTFDANGQYLKDFDKGDLKLTVYRNGNVIVVYLNNDLIGNVTVDEKYADAKCSVGFVGHNMEKSETEPNKTWKFKVIDVPVVTVEDETYDNAGGTISITTADVKVGDTVTITVSPDDTHILGSLTVSGGVTPVLQADGTYTFIATHKQHTVTATFTEKPATEVVADITGKKFDNSSVIIANDTDIVFTPESGASVTLKVADGKVKGILLPGTYTVTADGYYATTVTVTESFTVEEPITLEKLIFETNSINHNDTYLQGAANTNPEKVVASQDGKIYEWSIDEYGDIAVSFTFKKVNSGTQGIVMHFADGKDVNVRIEQGENTKVQWMGGMGNDWAWFWGTYPVNDLWDFGNGEDYANPLSSALLAKYEGSEGLKLTLVRRGGTVYVLIDGKIYSAQSVGELASNKVKFAVFVENASQGYEIPFEITTQAYEVLEKAGVVLSEDLTGFVGNWTKNEGNLAASGAACYAQFDTVDGVYKESVTMHISGSVGDDQGLIYKFSDGKYMAIRYQYNGGELKIQYTEDTTLFQKAHLKSWTDFMFDETEKQNYENGGLDLTFIRDGNTFYVMLGDRLLDTSYVDEKYAQSGGNMGIMVWNGKGNAFEYSHVIGDGVTAPANS